MPASDYGRSLHGLTLNLLVRDVATALPFQREVLGAEVAYDTDGYCWVPRRPG